MACRGVDRLSVASGGPVAAAVIWRTEMRAAFQHLARNADLRPAGVVALRLRGPAWILRHAARLRSIGRVARRPEIRRPLPHVANHIVEAVAVGGERSDR